MEVLPHFWVSQTPKSIDFISSKKIKSILFLSKYKDFYKNTSIEQLRIPLQVTDDNENDNVQIYQHLYDTTHFIYEKMITNKNIFLIGNEEDFSILYLFIVAYLIRYGKLSMQHSLQFLNSKIFIQSFRYHNALFQFYNENK